MTKLNQIVALEKGTKARVHAEFTRLYRSLLDGQTKLAGISRTYQPKDDDGDRLPAEGTNVQLRATDVLAQVQEQLTELFDLTLTKDTTNMSATADIVVDGQTLTSNVPVVYLLFLEKQLQELAIFIKALPTLDPAETWTWDQSIDCFRSAPTVTTRTKKIPRNHVKAEATQHHQAQVDVFFEDVVVGSWSQTRFSGALERSFVRELHQRLVKLSDAVKVARESANLATVSDAKIGERIFGYLFN